LRCFTRLADERRVCWDSSIKFYPVSLITYLEKVIQVAKGKGNFMNSITRWLENGWYVMIWQNQLGNYSAAAVRREEFNIGDEDSLFDCTENRITDAETPELALDKLGEKMLGNI